MSVALLNRLRSMDGAELRFRAAAAVRSRVHRARTALAPETWRREGLRLSSSAPDAIRAALGRGDWMEAHRLLARHFQDREPSFPLVPHSLPATAAGIRERFGAEDAVERAERILHGRYDLLGYRDVLTEQPPDWHRDPVHGRRTPLVFWDTVRYLDPALGDHKITWELNRHQHFLVLARAHAVTGDRRYYQAFVQQLASWIAGNPPLMGTNWASMLELGFRCLSWTWALHFFAAAASADDEGPWIVDLLLALERQLSHIEQNLSRYFSPNTHLTGEALALYVCGQAFPELAGSASYAAAGRDVLVAEAHRQVLPDGGHAELSAHYHRYSTDFYLLALNVARITGDGAESSFAGAAGRQAGFLRGIADDTGRLPLTGDDDGGQLFPICRRPPDDAADTLATAAVLLADPTLLVGPIPEETWWACGGTHQIPAVTLPPYRPASAGFEQSGYYVSRNDAGDYLLFDAGQHGFLNGGHAHADALAIVLTSGGRPLLIDPGTATYTMDPAARDRFRTTAMHNTVVVNGRSQSEPDGPFRWRTRTDAACVAWRPGPSADYVEGRHHGYAPLVHTRAVIALHGPRCWIVIDHLLGAAAISASVMWHLHPAWRFAPTDDRSGTLETTGGPAVVLASSAVLRASADPELHAWSPEYGRIEAAPCLAAAIDGDAAVSVCTVIAHAAGRTRITALDVEHPLPPGYHGASFRIDTNDRSLVVLSATEESGSAAPHQLPTQPWGPADFEVSVRAAVLHLRPGGPAELCVVPWLASSVHPRQQTPRTRD